MGYIFMMPALSLVTIYTIAAVLPAIVLLRYIYRHDRIEKEPPVLLASLLLNGVLSAFAAILLETVGMWILQRLVPTDTSLYAVLLAFLVVSYLLAFLRWAFPVFHLAEILRSVFRVFPYPPVFQAECLVHR